jgi:hypothetical protein
MFFAELHRASNDSRDLTTAKGCAQAIIDRGADWNVELCHGIGGNTQLLLALDRDTGGNDWLGVSDQRGEDAWQSRDCSMGCIARWPSADGTGAENPGLMVGTAGVGAFFLELASPEQLHSPLMP